MKITEKQFKARVKLLKRICRDTERVFSLLGKAPRFAGGCKLMDAAKRANGNAELLLWEMELDQKETEATSNPPR